MVRLTSAVLFLLAAASTSSRAAVLLYEGFSYSAGSAVNGQNGGAGFTGAWSESAASGGDLDVIQSGSLSFGALQTSGQSLRSQAPSIRYNDYSRDIADLPGTTGTTLWLSFLTRRDTVPATGSEDAFGLILYPNEGAGIFLGDPFLGNFYAVGDRGDGETAFSTVAVTPLQTTFLVVRIDFLDGPDTIRLFVNPTPGGTVPTAAAATKSDRDIAALDRLGVFANEPAADPRRSLDEIRIGTTFADVAPVPEPASLALITLGTLALLARRRTRHR